MSETNLGPKVPQQAGAPASSQASAPQRASQPAAYESAGPEPTKWVGWIAFASIMMVMLGTFHMIQGLVALFRDQYYLVGKSGLVVSVNYTTWGWVELIFGAIVLGAGAALVSGRMWARVAATIVALVSAVVNLGFLSAYPIWAAIMIALDVMVIWAITVHGAEMKTLRDERKAYG